MAGPKAIREQSRAAARRLGERSLLSDLGSRIYTLLVGVCVIRAMISVYFALTLALDPSIRGELAVLQLGVSGAAFSVLAGLQAARYAARIDGIPLFTETPYFRLFRRGLASRFLIARPFAAGGSAMIAIIGSIAFSIDGSADTAASVVLAFVASAALIYALYRFAPGAAVRKNGFTLEIATAAVAAAANPDVSNDGTRVASTLFLSAVPPRLLESRALYISVVYAAVATGIIAFFALSRGAERLGARAGRSGRKSVPVWAMPLRHTGHGHWIFAWAFAYILYAFSGRTAAAMVLACSAVAAAGSAARLFSFLGTCAQRLGDDGLGRFPAKYGAAATTLIALPHFLPCAILAFAN